MTMVDTLHVQLQLPNRVAQRYRRVCKEHAKLYLLNQTDNSRDLKGIILGTTRILFSSIDGCLEGNQLDSDAPIQRCSVDKETSEWTSRKYRLALCDNYYPDKVRIFTTLKTRMIAEDNLMRQIAKSIVSGLRRDQSDFCCKGKGKANDTRGGVSFSIPTGIVLQSDLGGGKTTMLKILYELYGSKRSYFLSSKNLVGKNKGDMESAIITLFMECIASDRRLILIDDIDILAPENGPSSSASDLYSSSALIYGIDTLVQRFNTESLRSDEKKLFILATCTDYRLLRQSLLLPHRLGDVSKILYLPFPSQKLRCSLLFNLLTCDGVNITWDTPTHSNRPNSTHRGSDGTLTLNAKDNEIAVTEKEEDMGKEIKRDGAFDRKGWKDEEYHHSNKSLKSLGSMELLEGQRPNSYASSALDLAVTLSCSTQGASVSDFVTALKRCFEQSVSFLLFPHIIGGLISTSSIGHCASNLTKHSIIDKRISIRASNFVQSVGEIRPAVALQHNIMSLLVDNSVSEVRHVLLCVQAIQKRLIDTVLMPYIDTSGSDDIHGSNSRADANAGTGRGISSRSLSRLKGLSLSHCSGVLIHGPSSCGKTSLACWLAQEGRKHFKLISVACADLVHKVVGESEKKLSEVFAAARKIAPCFLLLDDLEIILGSGSNGVGQEEEGGRAKKRTAHQALDRLLSTLLVEIDGLSSSRTLSKFKYVVEQSEGGPMTEDDREDYKPVIVIATTSDIRLIDRSLIRPGRLEEHIAMEMPSEADRAIMLKYFHEQMLSRGQKFHNTEMTEEQRGIIVKARRSMDLSSMTDTVAKLRSASELKNCLQERAMISIRALTDPIPSPSP